MKTKTFAQLNAQWGRIREYCVNRGWFGQMASTAIRYEANMKLYLRYFPAELRVYDEAKENTPVPASVYAKQV